MMPNFLRFGYFDYVLLTAFEKFYMGVLFSYGGSLRPRIKDAASRKKLPLLLPHE